MMAGPTMPAGRSAAERRQQKAERAASFRAAALDALDVDKGTTRRVHDPVFDGATELATKRATAAVEAGRPLRPSESRQIRHEVLGQQATASTPASKPRLRDRLEAMTEEQRLDVLAGIEGEREFAYVESLIDSIAADEAQAELRVALEDEQRSLANIDDSEDWQATAEETIALVGSTEWSDGLTEAERRAAADIAALTSGPLHTGAPEDDYDDLEAGYELDEEDE